jgi:L-cysteine desulfidase
MRDFTVKEILKHQVAPALGCTEPVAIALGAAAAASLLDGGPIDALNVWVDANIFKNGFSVAIPAGEGLSGIDTSSALGAVGGDPALGLEVLGSIDDEAVKAALALLKAGKVSIEIMEERGLYIRTQVVSGKDTAESVIKGLHDHIVSLSKNGVEITDSPLLCELVGEGGTSRNDEMEAWLKSLSLAEIIDLTDAFDAEDMAFLEEGITVNLRLAEHGLKHGGGLGIGKALDRLVRQKILNKDMLVAAKMLTAAASDARMSGVKLPAMSSAGSGNHGLTAILPIWAVKDFIHCDHDTVLKAIGLSHMVTAYVKAHTGRLSAVCGCSVAAGAGATSGIVYMMGGDVHHMAGAITNLIEDLAGVICDGAKAGCSLKLNTAAGSAVQSALFALQGVSVKSTDGIIGGSPEKTIANMGTLSTQGMIETDRTILKIMLEKKIKE